MGSFQTYHFACHFCPSISHFIQHLFCWINKWMLPSFLPLPFLPGRNRTRAFLRKPYWNSQRVNVVTAITQGNTHSVVVKLPSGVSGNLTLGSAPRERFPSRPGQWPHPQNYCAGRDCVSQRRRAHLASQLHTSCLDSYFCLKSLSHIL